MAGSERGALHEGFPLKLQSRRLAFEVIETEIPGEGESLFDRGEKRLWSKREQGGATFACLVSQAMPGGHGKAFEFAGRSEMEIEQDDREIAVAEEEVSALDGLGNLAATDPEELPAFEVAVRAGVEGITSVDEGEWEIAFLGEEFRNEQSHALIGLRGDDFVDATAFEGEVGGCLGFFGKRGRTMRGGEFFAKFPAKFIDF